MCWYLSIIAHLVFILCHNTYAVISESTTLLLSECKWVVVSVVVLNLGEKVCSLSTTCYCFTYIDYTCSLTPSYEENLLRLFAFLSDIFDYPTLMKIWCLYRAIAICSTGLT